MASLSVAKTSLIVADLDRSLRIYADGLGFTVNFIKPMAAGAFGHQIVGVPEGGRLRFAGLSGSGAQEGSFGLGEITGVALGAPGAIATSLLVIHLPALDEAMRRLSRIPGVTLIPERPMIGGGAGREGAFVDPDGRRIVLYRLAGD